MLCNVGADPVAVNMFGSITVPAKDLNAGRVTISNAPEKKWDTILNLFTVGISVVAYMIKR